MKTLICIFTLLLSRPVFADDIGGPSELVETGPSEKIGALSSLICAQFVGDGNKVAENVKKVIVNHMMRISKQTNPPTATPTQIIHFLNRNKHYMTCGDNNINYMMQSFRHGAYDQLFNVFLFDYLLVDDESLYVDINVISYEFDAPNFNPPGTLLDYMYRETQDPENDETTKKEIKDLIEFFEGDLGGKRYSELSAQEKQAGLDAHNDQKQSH